MDLWLCVLASPPVVTVLISDVNVVCEVVSSDSDCEIVEPQTLVSPGNATQVWLILDCETKMNLKRFEGTPVKAALATPKERYTAHTAAKWCTTTTRGRTIASLGDRARPSTGDNNGGDSHGN